MHGQEFRYSQSGKSRLEPLWISSTALGRFGLWASYLFAPRGVWGRV